MMSTAPRSTGRVHENGRYTPSVRRLSDSCLTEPYMFGDRT
ncbi:hypothetical protein BN903_62 [Halorubrum sp. AJ67]|nr:hypothetical protein BN903_62 [Halorubrum sp. AJ67]